MLRDGHNPQGATMVSTLVRQQYNQLLDMVRKDDREHARLAIINFQYATYTVLEHDTVRS